ncbi:MAG: hypothetical protein JWR68_1594 [Polaromonas sp.]|nr:hypothetical protein [Polaromonas sp.]
MNFKDLEPPIVELPAHQAWHRVQRRTARPESVRLQGFILAPPGGLAGRFDLEHEATAYLGDSELTALYESVFRREARSCHWDRLRQRALAGFETLDRLRLVDLRGLEERFPVLQSLRYDATQSFAAECRERQVDGVLYASAQHPRHGCLCLFEAGIRKTRRTSLVPLIKPNTERMHRAVMLAAQGSQVPIVR